jgi:hypothetical protein
MAVHTPPTATPAAAVSIAPSEFDERWAAWQEKGLAHDRAFQRKVTIAFPILIVVTAIVTYVLLGL